ncbi:MAG: tripartite tricarboxylate transporter substrate binding protein [Pseudomonadota bacterium]
MKRLMKITAAGIFVLFLTATLLPTAFGADWPGKKPISVVIQYKAGGGTDVMTRAYAMPMEATLKTTINAMNRPGALGALAMDFVNQKPSDGYWWIGGANFSKQLRVMGHTKLNWMNDWQYFKAANSIQGFAVKADSPFKTMKDFLDAAKKDPGKYSISNSGVGGLWAEGITILEQEAGIKVRQIPYKGGAPAALACLQGEVDVTGSGIHETIEFIRAGKLRNLAVFTKEAITLKDGTVLKPIGDFVPPMAAYAPFGGYYTLGVKRDTPKPILQKIADAFVKACNSPEFNALLEKKFFYKDVLIGEAADKAAARAESTTAWLLWDLKVEGVKVNPADLGIPKPGDFDKWWPPKGYKPLLPGK